MSPNLDITMSKRMSTTTANIPMSAQYMPQMVGIQQAPPVGRQHQAFPVRTFKVFGGVQIGLGLLLGLLSLIGVILDIISWNKYDDCINNNMYNHYDPYSSGYSYWLCRRYNDVHALFAFDITCLICSGWYVVTGFLPMCMSRKREASWMCLKTGFMVCSIIGASIFVPTMFSLGVVGSIIRGNHDSKTVILSAFMAVLSFAEVVVAIIAAAFCCCCSAWGKSNQQGVVIMQGTQPGMFLNLQQTQIPMANGHQVMMGTGQQANPIVQYPVAQQYQVMTTTQPTEQQVQAVGGTQPEPNGGQVFDTNPPAYKE
ncbi:Hypothetical predicted protein [Mytilus galloprovincialis]|uniref:Uncharacterized protein n=1 Tax=Mytilus galloprovincialis TaxID=29158 RepID=A0A8B6H8J4_MYTGA|nr:Hypothetical predicted protein [Mytilus galloprovincialis]